MKYNPLAKYSIRKLYLGRYQVIDRRSETPVEAEGNETGFDDFDDAVALRDLMNEQWEARLENA
jgi:hypothetical protein